MTAGDADSRFPGAVIRSTLGRVAGDSALKSATQKETPVKKIHVKRLTLNRETLRSLEAVALGEAQGALAPIRPIGSRIPCSNEISICVYCTSPLDTCPDPTVTIG